jgi:hypothetical protein
MVTHHSARFVIYQEAAGVWIGRGLEHDLTVESHSIGEAVRALMRLVAAYAAFDVRHQRPPLSAFKTGPQGLWNAFSAGTQVSLAQFGIVAPEGWDITVAIAHGRPQASPTRWPFQPNRPHREKVS